MKNVEELSAEIVDCGFHLHTELGPGLLESVYEVVLAKMLGHTHFASPRLRVNQIDGAE